MDITNTFSWPFLISSFHSKHFSLPISFSNGIVLQEMERDDGACADILGTLRNYDGDCNGNGNRYIFSKTTTLHVHHDFLYIFVSSLHDYDLK